MDERWISFREGASSSFGSALPMSLPVGRGWRGGHLRAVETIESIDELVQQIADRSVAAVGVWQTESFAYGIAAGAEEEPTPFLLGVDLGRPPAAAADAIGGVFLRSRDPEALSAWSVHAPQTVDPLEMDAAMQVDVNAVETWCQLLGMAVPVDREPDAADVAAQARAALTLAAERRRQRRSVDMSW